MKQMVYVVLDNGEVLGVYDEYADAEAVATETATITPVIVGQTDDCRVGCENPSEVIAAMEHELQNISVLEDADAEEEDLDDFEDDEDYEDEDEEGDEESDPIEDLVYDMDGQRVISKEDATNIYRMIQDIVHNDPRIPESKKIEVAQQLMIDFAKDHDIWGVDMRE